MRINQIPLWRKKVTMLSISHLFEKENIINEFRGMGGGRGRRDSYNAPMFAWSIYHDGAKPPFIPGRSDSHAVRMWNGIDIDREIPMNAIKELNSIPGIQPRASCQGHTNDPGIPDVNTYFIFRPENQDEKYIKSLISKLNKNRDIKSGYGMGSMKAPRIAVVAPFSYDSNSKEFKKWWVNLPKIIKKEL